MTKKEQQEQEKQEALARLHELLKPGDTLWTNVTHVSRSGMSRSIQTFIISDNEPHDISYLITRVLPWNKWDDKYGGLRVSGCGMDMGFHLVYSLSRAMFPDGFMCIGEGTSWGDRCPASDHVNPPQDRDYTPHLHERDGGYALRHRWL